MVSSYLKKQGMGIISIKLVAFDRCDKCSWRGDMRDDAGRHTACGRDGNLDNLLSAVRHCNISPGTWFIGVGSVTVT